MRFSIDKQMLECSTCGSVCEMDNYDMNNVSYEGAVSLEEDVRKFHCIACGAKVTIKQGDANAKCAYCQSEMAAFGEGDDVIAPEKIIPFKLNEDAARIKLFGWWTEHTTMPKFDINKLKISFKDIYVPVWMANANAVTEMSARIQPFGNNIMTPHNNIRKVIDSNYRLIPFDASCHIQDEQFNNIEPFNYSEMTEFHAGYISGHMAEVYQNGPQITLPRVIRRVKDFATKMIKEDIETDTKGGEILSINHHECDVTPSELIYLLVPVWVCRYEYEGKKQYVYINGQTGKVDGKVLFTGRIHELRIIEYGLSALFVGLGTAFFISSLFVGGIRALDRNIYHVCVFFIYFFKQLKESYGTDKNGKLSSREEIQLRQGMKVTASNGIVSNIIVAFIIGILDLAITLPAVYTTGSLATCISITIVLGLIITGFMTYGFARKLTNYETFTKSTRYIDYIKASDSRELVREIW